MMMLGELLTSRQQRNAVEAEAVRARLHAEKWHQDLSDTSVPGTWVNNRSMDAASNIYGRAWRDKATGASGVYYPHDYLWNCSEGRTRDCDWWYPLDLSKAKRVDMRTDVPRVRRA
jgi:hypothetical protein